MMKDRTFRECISINDNELVIYAADNFPQFPNRDESVTSKCDRTLAAASINDLVILRGYLDKEYYNWLRALDLGSEHVVEYGQNDMGMTLSELVINDPEPIKKIIRKTGRKPIYVPWFSGKKESEAANVLGAELFGAQESDMIINNDKASFKIICEQLNISVIEGVSFELKPQNVENYLTMKSIVENFLKRYSRVIIRGTLGESGMSLYKTDGSDLRDIYSEIANCGEKVVLIEPFLNVSSSPNDQWIISRNGEINHLGMRAQICTEGMIHIGTISELKISETDEKYITDTSLKLVNRMSETGYIGVVGLDYIVSDEGIFPVENNARFNGSSYSIMIINQIEKLMGKVPVWKFIKTKIAPCSFSELKNKLEYSLFDGVRKNSIFPYNCELLNKSGNFSILLLGDNMTEISILERIVNELESSA